MNKQEYNEHFEELLQIVIETREAGQEEYAHDNNNVFKDFYNTGELIGVKPEKVVFCHLNKHIRGISKYLQDGKKQRDNIQGRIVDSIVYLSLLSGMIKKRGL
tara:strand:- start:1277 stop:1585 length:309 start_codon:yes stop_codon:yes gene_type:complete